VPPAHSEFRQGPSSAGSIAESLQSETPVRALRGWHYRAFQGVCVLIALWTLYGTVYLVQSYTLRMVHLALVLAGVFFV